MECSVFNRRRVFSFAAASTPVAPRRPGAPGHGIANGLAPLLSSDHTGPANRECLQIRTSHGAPTSASIPPCNNPYGPGRGPSPIESTAFPYDEHTAKDTPPSRCLDGRRRSRRRPPPHARPMPSRAQEASPRFTTSVESSRSFGPPRLPANLRNGKPPNRSRVRLSPSSGTLQEAESTCGFPSPSPRGDCARSPTSTVSIWWSRGSRPRRRRAIRRRSASRRICEAPLLVRSRDRP